jgi:hypothetical protein
MARRRGEIASLPSISRFDTEHFMKTASAFNAAEQEPYQLSSWTILQEPPACREVTVLAGLKLGRRPKWC